MTARSSPPGLPSTASTEESRLSELPEFVTALKVVAVGVPDQFRRPESSVRLEFRRPSGPNNWLRALLGRLRSMANRLPLETSPYLLQHRENPVDWYPWGEEALGRAREEDRPILLSVGYSACHWCHVMERESFEDPG